ncbi:MAG: RelA/SpoT domain-containing protein [Methylococcaceae bacterium]
MNANDLQDYLEKNRNIFLSWGNFVSSKIQSELKEKIGIDEVKNFVKLPIKPRVKDVNSAVGKVARKGYTNPISQMTDFVGVRFVVLLSDDITKLCNIIESQEYWNAVLSKDYQDEIEKRPKTFDYQSQHYEVRPKSDFEFEGHTITTEMCCEIQIRTLLQHAYAELVHDSIYKPVGTVPHKAERQVARSMALMETTDELFCSTMKLLTDTNKPRNDFLNSLTSIYKNKISADLLKTDLKTNYALLDEFREFIKDNVLLEIAELVDEKKYILIKTKSRAVESSFFAQPVVLFVYWLAANIDKKELQRKWSLPGYYGELETVLSDMDM